MTANTGDLIVPRTTALFDFLRLLVMLLPWTLPWRHRLHLSRIQWGPIARNSLLMRIQLHPINLNSVVSTSLDEWPRRQNGAVLEKVLV